MRFRLGLLIVITLLVFALMAINSRIEGDRIFRTTCTEDMACWNCATMGNHICGTTGD
jgi:hypothetical protein